jgi:RNA polymerase sigma-70 factor (ECF subfamily)
MSDLHPPLTVLLADWRAGDQEAGNQVVTAAYQQLRRLAAHYLRLEHPDHTLQPTELVSELYLKLFSSEAVECHNRSHFMAVAARQLRRILVDHARARRTHKRGANAVKVSLTAVEGPAHAVDWNVVDVLDVDRLLMRLEALEPRAAAGVELRFFSGLTEAEIATVLDISLATLHRDWQLSRAWFISQLLAVDRVKST